MSPLARRALALLPPLALAACGSREPLVAPPHAMPVPAQAAAAQTTEQLLTPPPIARPERQDDSLRRSEEREDDPFDLPPAG
jgi:predicted small lipoprotein YifL